MNGSRNANDLHSSDGPLSDDVLRSSPQQPSKSTKGPGNLRSLRQEAQVRLASMASQKENRDPIGQPPRAFKSSDVPNRAKRRTLGEINTRASQMHDSSIVEEDRPRHTGPVMKGTRFSSSKWQSSREGNNVTDTANTNQSYLLPNLPNISQLVSTSSEKQVPKVTHRSGHPAISQTPTGPVHRAIDAVPIPDDERAIFISLNVLQGKVTELESAAIDFRRTIDELKTKNITLKEDRRALKRENDLLRRENQELRTSHGFDEEDSCDGQTGSTQASHHTRNQRSTDAAAQVNSEVSRLLDERQTEELFSLTRQKARDNQPNTGRPQDSGVAASKKPAKQSKCKGKSRAAPSGHKDNKRVVIDTNAGKHITTSDGQRDQDNPLEKTTENMTFLTTQEPPRALFDLRNLLESERAVKKLKSMRDNQEAVRKSDDGAVGNIASGSRDTHSWSKADEATQGRRNAIGNALGTAAGMKSLEAKKGISLAPRTGEAVLENAALNQLTGTKSHGPTLDGNAANSAPSNTSRRRKPAMEENDDENMSEGLFFPNKINDKLTRPTAEQADAMKAGGQPSAFTAAAGKAQRGDTVQLTEAAKHIVHSLDPHDAANCIVCSRLTNSGNPQAATIKMQNPTLASAAATASALPTTDKTTDLTTATIRPSQPPELALACVLKELSDQHSHAKRKLIEAQLKYQQLDPKFSRKKRERLNDVITGLLGKVENLAAMVYRLWDVVEGLKRIAGKDESKNDQKDKKAGMRGEDGGKGKEKEKESEVMDWDEVEITIMGLRDVVAGMDGRNGHDGDTEDDDFDFEEEDQEEGEEEYDDDEDDGEHDE